VGNLQPLRFMKLKFGSIIKFLENVSRYEEFYNNACIAQALDTSTHAHIHTHTYCIPKSRCVILICSIFRRWNI